MTAALRRHFDTSDELCAYVREVSGPTVIVSFSRGKDAIAALAQVRRFFDRVVLFHLDQVPGGLRIENEDIARWEQSTGTKVYRYTHPGTVRMLRGLVYQPPGRWEQIEAMGLPSGYDYEAIEADVRRRAGCPDAFVASGVRQSDSLVRRANISRFGSLNPARRSFFPVFDWKIDEVESSIREMREPLPIDYKLFARSLDGIDRRFMEPLREEFPDDYETILRWFPLADLDSHRTTLRSPR